MLDRRFSARLFRNHSYDRCVHDGAVRALGMQIAYRVGGVIPPPDEAVEEEGSVSNSGLR
jgi:hypothetical protein